MAGSPSIGCLSEATGGTRRGRFTYGVPTLLGVSLGALLTAVLCEPVGRVSAADAPAEAVVRDRVLADIKLLASDELEGRGVGTKGLDVAAEYVRASFAKSGLDVTRVNGGALQTFELTTGAKLADPNSLTLVAPDGTKFDLKPGTDYTPLSFGGAGAIVADLLFVGYGIEAADKQFDEYAGLDVKGKFVVIVRKTPQQAKTDGPFTPGHGGVGKHADLQTKVSTAFAKGAAGVIFVNDPFTSRKELDDLKKQATKVAENVANLADELDKTDAADATKFMSVQKLLKDELDKYRRAKDVAGKAAPDTLMKFGYGGEDATRSIPLLHATRDALDKAFRETFQKSWEDWEKQVDTDLKPLVGDLKGWKVTGTVTIDRQKTPVHNVIGVLEGTGPLAQETIVVGAHYDHVGRGGKGSLAPGSTDIHNGADDNASGTTCLLEVARRIGARSEKLPRRVVFIAFTAEELGLFGSARYVKEPLFPLEQTVAMLNMDMVGRLAGEKLTVYGTGTSPVWEPLLKKYGPGLGFQFAMKPEGFGPSDHSSFYAKKIPVLHFFTGTHNDYHRPSDDWEKINLGGIERVAELTEKILVEVATAPAKPEYISIAGNANPLRDTSRPYFGSIPDFGVETPATRWGAWPPAVPPRRLD